MKRAIKALVASIFITCLNISYVTAEPLPGIQPFVGANGIKQPAGSNWCVRACTDVALSYLKVLQDNNTIGAGEGAITPGVMAQMPRTTAALNITMPFAQIEETIAHFSHNNPQITCTRKVIYGADEEAKKLRRKEAYDEIYSALNAAQLQQTEQEIPEGQRPGIAILHFEGGGHHHACITYGFNGTKIEVHDPMPSRSSFTVTKNAFRYMVGVVPRVLTEYCLIQW